MNNKREALNAILKMRDYIDIIDVITAPWGQCHPERKEVKEFLKGAPSRGNLFQQIRVKIKP